MTKGQIRKNRENIKVGDRVTVIDLSKTNGFYAFGGFPEPEEIGIVGAIHVPCVVDRGAPYKEFVCIDFARPEDTKNPTRRISAWYDNIQIVEDNP